MATQQSGDAGDVAGFQVGDHFQMLGQGGSPARDLSMETAPKADPRVDLLQDVHPFFVAGQGRQAQMKFLILVHYGAQGLDAVSVEYGAGELAQGSDGFGWNR